MNIAIQGILGSFHDIAARRYFGDADLDMICCNTFEAVFDALRNGSADWGLVAIENTIAGSLASQLRTTARECRHRGGRTQVAH